MLTSQVKSCSTYVNKAVFPLLENVQSIQVVRMPGSCRSRRKPASAVHSLPSPTLGELHCARSPAVEQSRRGLPKADLVKTGFHFGSLETRLFPWYGSESLLPVTQGRDFYRAIVKVVIRIASSHFFNPWLWGSTVMLMVLLILIRYKFITG